MLARSSILRHRSGVILETPLLVPAFSSKGFGFNKDGLSEVTDVLKTTAEVITECMLVSAYDIFHRHIPSPIDFPCVPEVIFVDSGGYETLEEYDFSAVFKHQYEVKDWDEASLRRILGSWPSHLPAVFVSYDSREAIQKQVEAARELFKNYHNNLHTLVVKPETKDQRYVQLPSIIGHINEIGQFHIIGLTEKELGNSMLKRMENIAKIRIALDEAGISTPIQIFGGLDPLSSYLYFLAGAEIFDSLTWLRYSYLDGTAIYSQNYGALCIGIHVRDSLVQLRTLVDNIYYLQNMQYAMKAFLLEHDFRKFGRHAQLLQESYDKLRTKLKWRV